MPLYNGCKNCGYSEHISHGSNFCPKCGKPLSLGTDTREFDTEQARAFAELHGA